MTELRCNATIENGAPAQSSSNEETGRNKHTTKRNTAQNPETHIPPLISIQPQKRLRIDRSYSSAVKSKTDSPTRYTSPLVKMQLRNKPVGDRLKSSEEMQHVLNLSPPYSKLPLNEACNIPGPPTFSRGNTINSLGFNEFDRKDPHLNLNFDADINCLINADDDSSEIEGNTFTSAIPLNEACNIPGPPPFFRANTLNSLASNDFDKKSPLLNLNCEGDINRLINAENDGFDIESDPLTSSGFGFLTVPNKGISVKKDEKPIQAAKALFGPLIGSGTALGGVAKTELTPHIDSRQRSVQFTDRDVLLGRGGMTNKHLGNQTFRDLVERVKPMYHGYESKAKKKSVSQLVVDDIQQKGGRFLKNLRKDINSRDEWVIAKPDEARKKASQALREARSKK